MKHPKHAANSYYAQTYKAIAILICAIALTVVALLPAFNFTATADEAATSQETAEWQKADYEAASKYYEELHKKESDASTYLDEFNKKYGNVATDDEKLRAAQLCALMRATASCAMWDADKKEFDELKSSIDQRIASQRSYSSYSGGGNYAMPSGDGILSYSNGSNKFQGHRETWYSMKEPGQTQTAWPIPGKHVGDDGIVRDKDGYICVASKHDGQGTIIETSLGTGKVYDKCGTGAIDIYTNW